MDDVSGSVTLQKQIASIMDELSKAAVMEISKVVDDGVVMLKLEICEREHEIDSLKRNLQMVSEELRQTRRALVRQCVGTGRSTHLLKGVTDNVQSGSEPEARNEDPTRAPPGVVVKLESVDEDHALQKKLQRNKTEPDSLSSSAATEQSARAWPSEGSALHLHSTASEQDTQGPSEDDELSVDSLHAAQNGPGLPQSHPYPHGALLHSPPDCPGADFGALHLEVFSRGRPTAGPEKRRYACAFCIKSFDRLSHLERHQRIHTGEKPFSCMLCGRCFTQKSSLKSHLKTHRGLGGDFEASLLHSDGSLFSDEWTTPNHAEDQVQHHLHRTAEEVTSYLEQEASHFIDAEGESTGSNVGPETRDGRSRPDHVTALEDAEDPTHMDSGSDSVMDDVETGAEPLHAAPQPRFESSSTVLHSWWSAPSPDPDREGVSQIHLKQEERAEQNAPRDPDGPPASPVHPGSLGGPGPTSETPRGPGGRLNGRERRFLCVLCGKSFDRLSHLDRHQRIHTGEKPYSCGTCGRRFTQKSSLKGHMRTHAAQGGFSCTLCGMSFPTRASQYRHQCS